MPITKKDHSYNDVPSPDDQVHVLVCVYPANVPKMDKIVLQNMKEIREEASILGKKRLNVWSGNWDKGFVVDRYSLEHIWEKLWLFTLLVYFYTSKLHK